MWVVIFILLSLWFFYGAGIVLLGLEDHRSNVNLLWKSGVPLYKKFVYLLCTSGPLGLVLIPIILLICVVIDNLFKFMFWVSDKLGEWMGDIK